MINDNNINIDKLYNKLLPSINKIYTSYSFIGLNQKKMEIIIKDIILNLYIKNKDNKVDNNFYIKSIKEQLDLYIKTKLKNQDNIIIYVNNYINNNLSLKPTTSKNIKELKKLSRFLKKYDLFFSPDTYIEFIKSNNILLSIIKDIVEKNKKTIKEKGIEFIDEDINIATIIGIYCMINNIEYLTYEDIQLDINNEEDYDKLINDSLKMYLYEIKLPVLTPNEEYELAKRKAEGDIEARNKLIEHNLKWVVCVARRYLGKGLDFLELIQEGNAGLIIAIDRFDHTKGFRISTYSYHWIRQSITRAIIDKSRMIRLPIHIDEKIKKYKKAVYELEQKLNRKPTNEEIAEELNIKIEDLNNIYIHLDDVTSLNARIGIEDESELEIFAESIEENLEEKHMADNKLKEIKNIFQKCCLDDREIKVLLLRNGFCGEIYTLAKVGEILGGLSRERVRQIECKALQKIRMSSYVKTLAEYTKKPDESLKNIQAFRNFYNSSKKSTKSLKTTEILELTEYVDEQEIIVESEETKTIITIFDKFIEQGYTKEEVIDVLKLLPTQDKKRVMLRNGIDLEHPVVSELIKEKDRRLYITKTLPTIKKLLIEQYGKRTKTRKKI